jgi:hypothetical protein
LSLIPGVAQVVSGIDAAAGPAPANRKEAPTIHRLHDWLEEHAPGWLFTAWCWPQYRLFGRCFAQGCGRLVVLHTPRQLDRCETTPLGVMLTVQGWLLSRGMDPGVLAAWCEAYGIDPAAPVQVLDHATTASHADVSA